MLVPKDLKYTKSHEWIKIAGEEAIVGITDYAQEELGEVVFVEMPDINSYVEEGSSIGVIESIKSVSEIYAPLSGMVKEVNNNFSDQPQLINQSPYDKGWILKIQIDSKEFPREYEGLLSAEEYVDEVGGATA